MFAINQQRKKSLLKVNFYLEINLLLTYNEVGDRMNDLRKLRIKNKYSCKYMANMIGISKTYYWQIENGKRRVPYHLAVLLASFFETTPDHLFYEDTKKRLERKNRS